MKLSDLGIGTQLRLGLGVLVALLLGLSALAWTQGRRLASQTQELHDHPLQVRRALYGLQSDVLLIHRDLRDLMRLGPGAEADRIVAGVERREVDARQRIEVLRDRYLGPRADAVQLLHDLERYRALRDETLHLLRVGRTDEAVARTRRGGVVHRHVDLLLGHLDRVSDFAMRRGERFYHSARAEQRALEQRIVAVAGLALVLALLIAWLLLRGIRTPIADLTEATGRFRAGELGARSGYVAQSETGILAASFDAMADAVALELTVRKQVSEVADALLRESDLPAFSRAVLATLVEHTGSQVGAVYRRSETGEGFEHVTSLGLGDRARAAFSAADQEGEVGAAVAAGRILHVRDLPADSRFTFHGVSGDFVPRELLTLPIRSGDAVVVVIALASLRPYPETALRLVNDAWTMLCARTDGVLAFARAQALARRLEDQNRELDVQARELQTQAAELVTQNAELTQQHAQLEAASRLKSTFLSNMSHELRTPLNSVIALSGVLARRTATTLPEEERSYLEIIERNGKHLLALINDILDLSRIEAGREDVRREPVDLQALITGVLDVIRPLAAERGLGLTSQVPADLPRLETDPDKCRHILQNLLANAVKFTDQGQVTVTARARDGRLELDVTDTGIGVAADQLDLIFEEFRQADDTPSRRHGGTGLGLTIARRYARLLGGDLEARSTPGAGSTFTLRLPLTGATPTAPGRRKARSSGRMAAAAGHGERILLVEDSEPAVIQLTDILVAQGYHVDVARDGAAALARLPDARPDAILLDLMMPGVDGFQVLAQLRKDPRTAAIPVLILTAKHVTREELSFLEGNHIHQLIQKGDIDRAGLLAAVAEMVATPGPPPAPLTSRLRRSARPRPLVLVVEDNPDNLATAIALLADTCDVVEATDGQAAVDQARRHVPDLILMDLALPVMDGIQALAELRRDETLRGIPVYAVTASAMKGDRESILAQGFDGYLAKPIDSAELGEIVNELKRESRIQNPS